MAHSLRRLSHISRSVSNRLIFSDKALHYSANAKWARSCLLIPGRKWSAPSKILKLVLYKSPDSNAGSGTDRTPQRYKTLPWLPTSPVGHSPPHYSSLGSQM